MSSSDQGKNKNGNGSGRTNNDLHLKEKLINSKIGLINAGGSCYMASIVQILMHLRKFLDIFLSKTYNNNFSKKFQKFLKLVAETHYQEIEIKQLADEYNKSNNKFNGEEGNNPMTFFTELIKELNKDNKDIQNLFLGEKSVKLKDFPDDYNEKFLFYLVILDKNNCDITTFINKKTYDDEKEKRHNNPILQENIVKIPDILIINLEIENTKYEGEEIIIVQSDKYKLIAVNKYTDHHSIS